MATFHTIGNDRLRDVGQGGDWASDAGVPVRHAVPDCDGMGLFGLLLVSGGQGMNTLSTLAGIILREHDDIDQAIRFAERMARWCAGSHPQAAFEYSDATEELRRYKLAMENSND